MRKSWLLILLGTLLFSACDYIVLPEEELSQAPTVSRGWSAVTTGVTSAAGVLHVDLTIRNETGAWSAMQATPGKPAVLTTGTGKTDCATVMVSTGGHRLAPGFQMRGFVAGTKAEPAVQLLYVECQAETAPGATLSLSYSYLTGDYNYYYPEENKVEAELSLSLDQVAAKVQYPIAEQIEGVVQPADLGIEAINKCALTLAGVQRTGADVQFTWQAANPGEYPSYVHIGLPPVIGSDGIIYGLYESPDLASVPVAGAGQTAEWTTMVAVPQDVHGLYILLSVESKKQRLFTHYAIAIADQ